MRSIEDMKKFYEKTQVPEDLDQVVQNAIIRGSLAMKNKKRVTGYIKAVSSLAAAILIFTIALNTSPAFANTVKQLPGGETIVRLLTFVGDTAIGGEITDGQDIKDIEVEAGENYEVLTVDLYQMGEPADIAGHFTITHKTHPYSILIGTGGVRAFSAADAFPDLSGMELFDDIYKLITLDDSANRFVVTFKKPVIVEVTEQQNPARMIIKVREDTDAQVPAPMYSLRTASFPFGESIGVAENMLTAELDSENARLLRDSAGMYIAEEGLYSTFEEAEARLAEIKTYEHFTFEMHIEKREPGAVPISIE